MKTQNEVIPAKLWGVRHQHSRSRGLDTDGQDAAWPPGTSPSPINIEGRKA